MATKAEEKAVADTLYHLNVCDPETTEAYPKLIKLLDAAYDRGYANAVADAEMDGNFGGK